MGWKPWACLLVAAALSLAECASTIVESTYRATPQMPQHVDVADRFAAVGDQFREVGRDPASVMDREDARSA